MKPKYCEKTKLCYMDRENFIVYIKTDNNHEDNVKDVETRFDTPYSELDIPFTRLVKSKKEVRLMNDELGGKIIIQFVRLRAKAYR